MILNGEKKKSTSAASLLHMAMTHKIGEFVNSLYCVTVNGIWELIDYYKVKC